MTHRRPTLIAFAVILSCLAAACDSCNSDSAPSPTVTSVTITSTATLTAPGQTTQLTERAALSNGSTQDVTSQATWQSSNTAVATVSSTGLVTIVTFGQVDITATFQSVSGKTTVTLQLNLTGTWKGTGSDSTGSST